MMLTVSEAVPGAWPVMGPIDADSVAVLAIDLQRDFVEGDGSFGSLGFDLTDCQRATEQSRRLVTAAQERGIRVVFTRQGNAADLSDLPSPRQAQGRELGNPIGTPGPLGPALIRGEAGWDLTAGFSPELRDVVTDKPGFSSLHGTHLEEILQDHGIRGLIVCGVTANVCVLATLYAALDRGFDCLTVSDAVGASDGEVRRRAISFVEYQGDLFGRTATTEQVVGAMAW